LERRRALVRRHIEFRGALHFRTFDRSNHRVVCALTGSLRVDRTMIMVRSATDTWGVRGYIYDEEVPMAIRTMREPLGALQFRPIP